MSFTEKEGKDLSSFHPFFSAEGDAVNADKSFFPPFSPPLFLPALMSFLHHGEEEENGAAPQFSPQAHVVVAAPRFPGCVLLEERKLSLLMHNLHMCLSCGVRT